MRLIRLKKATRLSFFIFFIGVAGLSYAADDVEKWIDASGNTHYGSAAPKGVEAVRIKGAVSGPTSAAHSHALKVHLYTTSWCGFCKKARKYLSQNGIAYQDNDIEKNRFAKSAYDRAGGTGIPLLVQGDATLQGFNENSYDRFFADK